MENLQEHLTILKDVLVKEFRACQALHELSKEERLVLTSKDICDLLILIGHKEAVLDEMRQEGIIALSSSIRNITYSNRAQAKEGLERVETVKSFLFDLFQPVSN